ncbi:Protein stoned-B [Dirofilaria immitis]|nr:Protein stoned-B [Dirofilaria immitis]
MPLYDIQTISDDQKRFAVSTASNPSENAENSKQNLNYDYDTTQYQNYEQQQQQKQGGSSVYQNYDQMSYVTAFQTYDQQSAVSNDYGQQPVIMRDYDQSITLSGYGISEYDQSEEYSYDQAIGYNAYSSSIVPSANNQNYMSQTVSESYSEIVERITYSINVEKYLDINKKSSNDFGAQQYEQRNAENLPMDINDDGYRPPIIPKYIAPLFPTVISSEPNPFSWEAQENAAATTFAESIPEYVVQSVQPSSTKTYLETTNEIDSAEEIKQKPPLQRPASPSPSVERVIPPIRPPPPPPPLPLSPNRKQSLHQATISVKSTEEKLKELEKTTAAKDLKDESYLAQIGGSQACISEQAYRHAREKGSIAISQEDDMDRAAIELAKKMAATRIDMQDWKMPLEQHDDESVPYEKPNKLSDEILLHIFSSMIVPNESRKDDMIDKETSNILKESNITTTFNRESNKRAWTGFDDSQSTELPPSESGFFTNISAATVSLDKAFGDPMFASDGADASIKENLIDEDYDPFNVCPADDLVKEAKARVAAAIAAEEIQDDINFFTAKVDEQKVILAHQLKKDDAASTPSPLYDEDDSEPLTDFPVKFTGDGWEMMIRYPIKKKIINDRYWKPCYVRLRDNTLLLFNSKAEQKPFMEILLQATYSLSDPTLQAYDVYGKIHTVKLQYVLYKERVGIRPGQISRLVEGHVTKYGLPLEHSAQCTVLLKFGSLNAAELFIFVATVEDILFRCIAVRNNTPLYKQDEVQIHCYDEYSAYVDKFNILSDQKARVRLFCLAFVSGSPILEIGLNDRRRQGKEIVRRKDILPMYTERWIRFENLEFHNTVDRETFEKEQVIRLSPPDGCFFEVQFTISMMRFRVRPPKNREKPLTVRCVMKIAGSKVEIRIEAMAAAQTEKTKGGLSNKRQVPCEDIQIRFPIPEAWIYLFREERRWGVGSVHAKVRRPGKVKNLKDRLMGTVHNLDNSLIEAAIGEAKYEHVFRALVWRIPRLPEKYHAAYKEHLLRCHFELSSFDLMPETFTPTCDVEFTMPLAMISNTVVRSVSVEQHEDSDRVEKFVRYVAKCTYKVEIDYVQCSDLDIDAIYDLTITNPAVNLENIPEPHKAMFNPDEVKELHGGYRIDFSDAEIGAKRISSDADSSNDEEEDRRRAIPIVQIDPKRYNY